MCDSWHEGVNIFDRKRVNSIFFILRKWGFFSVTSSHRNHLMSFIRYIIFALSYPLLLFTKLFCFVRLSFYRHSLDEQKFHQTSFPYRTPICAEWCHIWFLSARTAWKTEAFPDIAALAVASEDFSSGADKTLNHHHTPQCSDSHQLWLHSCQPRMRTLFHTFHSQWLSV